MTIGERISELRKKNSMTQPMLADAMDVSQSTITSWENNRRAVGNEDLIKLADLFHVTTDYLLGNKQTPDWASDSDVLELKDFLNSNVNMAFGGVTLDAKQKKRVDEILTQIYWDELQKEKKRRLQEGNANE